MLYEGTVRNGTFDLEYQNKSNKLLEMQSVVDK